ncbi:MAG: Feruloyl esterase [Acidimicrobiia bacterium]|nr:Feruloyl esterase [Acidimicrobiia bacterium]
MRGTLAILAALAVVLATVELRPAAGESGESGAPVPPAAAPSTVPALHWGGTRADRHQLVVDGWARTWTVVAPRPEPGHDRFPLVVVLHGRGGTGASMRSFGFDALAAKDRVIVAYPDGLQGSWNDGREGVDSFAHLQHVDESHFIEAIVADAVANYSANPARVGVIGYSNGALLASLLSCRAQPIAVAFALVSGPGAAGGAAACRPPQPVPVLEVHSLGDPIVAYQGGPIASADGHSRGSSMSVEQWRQMWQTIDGCTSWTNERLDTVGPAVTQLVAAGCRSGGEVVSDVISDATHRWHRAPDFDTSLAAWSFVASRLDGTNPAR